MKSAVEQLKLEPAVASKLAELIRRDDEAESYALQLQAIDADVVQQIAKFIGKPGEYSVFNDPTGKVEAILVRNGPVFDKLVREATREPAYQDDALIQQMEDAILPVALEDPTVHSATRNVEMPYEAMLRYFSVVVKNRIGLWAARAAVDVDALDVLARTYLEQRVARSLSEYLI